MSNYSVVEKGTLYSLDYRCFLKGPNGLVSPWHDVPLYADSASKTYNMIVEIPQPLSPIKQDEKNGKPRFVHNIFPHHGYIWNYGALPQTWENPEHKDEHTGALGDNDPIDVVEIGNKVQTRGAVVQVKILGVLGLLDDGETDWKLVAIDVTDPLASQLNTIEDVEKVKPGLLPATYNWFRVYKIPTGKPPNVFAFDGQFKDANFAHKIIAQTNEFWKALIGNPNPPLNTESHVEGTAKPANDSQWEGIVSKLPDFSEADKRHPDGVDEWHHVTSS